MVPRCSLVNRSADSYSQYADHIVQAITAWAIKDALWGISNLMHSFGDSTEPDFVALAKRTGWRVASRSFSSLPSPRLRSFKASGSRMGVQARSPAMLEAWLLA